jgi:alpha-tubulin suppressor-like RCC1 family protein
MWRVGLVALAACGRIGFATSSASIDDGRNDDADLRPTGCVAQIAAGHEHTCARREDGSALCWGQGTNFELGDGAKENRSSPVAVATTGLARISIGGRFTCGIDGIGKVRCWGQGNEGQLGDGQRVSSADANLVPATRPVAFAGHGARHSVFVLDDGTAVHSGCRRYQQAIPKCMTPDGNLDVLPVNGISAIGVGSWHTCGISGANQVFCFGDNSEGQLGDGGTTFSAVPVFPTSADATSIAAGRRHTCIITTDGGVECWGDNSSGQLGDGTQVTRGTPAAVPGLGEVVQLAAGGGFTCARTTDGAVRCWGSNGAGQLAQPIALDVDPNPRVIEGLPPAIDIAVGTAHACALDARGVMRCWGWSNSGQLGLGDAIDRAAPEIVAIPCP